MLVKRTKHRAPGRISGCTRGRIEMLPVVGMLNLPVFPVPAERVESGPVVVRARVSFQECVPVAGSCSACALLAVYCQPRLVLSHPASSKARVGLGETSPSSVRVGTAKGATACSISIEFTPARYGRYSATSKNWATNCRQGLMRQ